MATSPTVAAATETARMLNPSSYSLEAVVRCRYPPKIAVMLSTGR
ncbi:hypothetical protein [Arthrobacter sp. AK01]|nr:hypothetical protein [Arthrobacter sp. AK01]